MFKKCIRTNNLFKMNKGQVCKIQSKFGNVYQGQRQYEHAEMRDKLDNNDQRFGRPSFQSKSSNHSRGNQFNDQRHDFRDNQLPPHRQRYHPQDNIPQSQPYFNPQERGDNYQHHQHGPKNYHPQQQFGNQGQSQQRRDNYLSRSRSNEHFPVSPNDQMPPRRSHEMHEQSLSYRNVPPGISKMSILLIPSSLPEPIYSLSLSPSSSTCSYWPCTCISTCISSSKPTSKCSFCTTRSTKRKNI